MQRTATPPPPTTIEEGSKKAGREICERKRPDAKGHSDPLSSNSSGNSYVRVRVRAISGRKVSGVA
jgi:hypothetical protein